MKSALPILVAVAEAEELVQSDGTVDEKLVCDAAGDLHGRDVAHGLAWGLLVGAISYGSRGLALNPIIRSSLPKLLQPAGA